MKEKFPRSSSVSIIFLNHYPVLIIEDEASSVKWGRHIKMRLEKRETKSSRRLRDQNLRNEGGNCRRHNAIFSDVLNCGHKVDELR